MPCLSGQVKQFIFHLQTLPAVGEPVAHGVVGKSADLRKAGAVPGLHRGEAVASMGEGEHLAQAGSTVAVKACDVAVPVRNALFSNDLPCCLIINFSIICAKLRLDISH